MALLTCAPMIRSQPTTARVALQLLLLAVFVLPALVPTGYMLRVNPESNLVEVTICSGVNHRSAWVDIDTGEYFDSLLQSEAPQSQVEVVDSEICPFAVGGVALNDSGSLVPHAAFADEVPRCCVSHGFTSIGYKPPATGPPELV